MVEQGWHVKSAHRFVVSIGNMNILIVAVGRQKAGAEKTLLETYLKRLPWKVSLREIDIRSGHEGPARTQLEAERILDELPVGAKVVAFAHIKLAGRRLPAARLYYRWRRWIGRKCPPTRQQNYILRCRHMAPHVSSRDARRTTIPRRQHYCRPSLSSRLSGMMNKHTITEYCPCIRLASAIFSLHDAKSNWEFQT
jgi:hypothetical protein